MRDVGQLEQAPDAFAGASFHCYSGSVSNQTAFHDIFPDKVITFAQDMDSTDSIYRKYTLPNALEYLGLTGGTTSK